MSLTISQRFDNFLAAIRLTELQAADGRLKLMGVLSTLNERYWGSCSTSEHGELIGSWGKSTRVRPPRDIDILFELPESVYNRFQRVVGNRQSQLLQEVKRTLQTSYSTTEMRADGQVVVVPFSTQSIEIAPAFRGPHGQFLICDTNSGGTYKTVDPIAEMSSLEAADRASNGTTRDLILMMKTWQRHCNIPLKSFWIELLAAEFVRTWTYAGKGTVFYDWLCRDFLEWVIGRAGGCVCVSGTYEIVWIGREWVSRAERARDWACRACSHDLSGAARAASAEWQNLFGGDFPSP